MLNYRKKKKPNQSRGWGLGDWKTQSLHPRPLCTDGAWGRAGSPQNWRVHCTEADDNGMEAKSGNGGNLGRHS